jgi:phenylpropionate dioxygenase-like ring-hydroxylating dioxygenase large terminal subunit
MRLSLGKVAGGRLACPYHGWTFDAEGSGESPGTPKLHARAESYDCREAHGAVWVKSRGPDAPLPEIDHAGYVPVGVTAHRIRAPFPLVMDNFSEVEHTVSMHPAFGFDPARGGEAVVSFEPTADAVHVRNAGPAKAPRPLARLLLLFRRRFLFHSEYTLRYDPPRATVEHFWSDPAGGRGGMARYRLHHFFVPEDDRTTRLVTFGAARSRWPLPAGGVPLMGWYMLRAMGSTIDEDVRLLENLADQDPDIEGMKLGRFDRVLGLNRERLRRIYLGGADIEQGGTR